MFRPCRFSRLRRLSPQLAFRHFSAGNTYGVATLQSILSCPLSEDSDTRNSLPVAHKVCILSDATGQLTLVSMSETGSRSVRGPPCHSPWKVDSASHRVSDFWGAQLSWASSGGHLTKARLPVSAGATPASRPPRSPVVSERLFPPGLFSLRRPPDQLGFRSWAFPSHQDESWCFAATAPTSHVPHGTRSN